MDVNYEFIDQYLILEWNLLVFYSSMAITLSGNAFKPTTGIGRAYTFTLDLDSLSKLARRSINGISALNKVRWFSFA
jgi:hypothetical protein